MEKKISHSPLDWGLDGPNSYFRCGEEKNPSVPTKNENMTTQLYRIKIKVT
jgi:hypothetical protein